MQTLDSVPLVSVLAGLTGSVSMVSVSGHLTVIQTPL